MSNLEKLNPILACIFLLASWSASAQSPMDVYTREKMSLDGKWHYIVDPYENGYYDYRRVPFDEAEDAATRAFYTHTRPQSKSDRVEYDFTKSPTLLVPGDWNSQVPELLWYEGTIWYQRDFRYEARPGEKVFIHFGAANYETHVYVNGRKAGSHVGGFTPFSFEVTGLLRKGDNFVVVKVDNTRKKEAVPTNVTDWWNYGGITRSVSLVAVPEQYIVNHKLQLAKDGQSLTGFVQTTGAAGKQVTVSIPELKLSRTFSTDDNGKVNIQIPVRKLERWDLGNPKLYAVNFSFESDQISDRIGFRTIETKGTDILLNGKKVFLKGICAHEENPMEGRRSYSRADAQMMFNWVKELNGNFVRLSHYPHNEHVPRLADELGVLLWEEVPVYWTIDWENPATLQLAKNQVTELVQRDQNRASVIIWSMANETPVKEQRNAFLRALVETTRTLDESRLISAALEVHADGNRRILDDPFGAHTDIVSFNQYHGWYGGDPAAFKTLQWEIKYNKPVLISEWGGGALYGYHADEKTVWSEEYQANLYEKTLEGVDNIPGLSGMTPWILSDFRSPRRPLAGVQDYWNIKGVIARGGHKKMAFDVLRKYYSGK